MSDLLPKLLYISSNDGTDMRINKEVRTLSSSFNVIFLGVAGEKGTSPFLEKYCHKIFLVTGKRNHPITLLKQILAFLKILIGKRIHSIHIVNEQLMVFFWPFLFFKHTVLDVFDSLFMRYGFGKEKLRILKRLVYAPSNQIVVTDENRRKLMPDFLQSKIIVLPNYPFKYKGSIRKTTSNETLHILFFGWLGMNRGGSIAKGLLESDERIRLIMLGWFSDDDCRKLAEQPRVEYRGVLPQDEASKIAATEADYILCLYEPSNNLNMLNASPNKIYDGIQTRTPLIINKEVGVSSFVQDLKIGLVIPTYYHKDFKALAQELIDKKHCFNFSDSLKNAYSWERIENRLLTVHRR